MFSSGVNVAGSPSINAIDTWPAIVVVGISLLTLSTEIGQVEYKNKVQ